jgi:hypothetical protein
LRLDGNEVITNDKEILFLQYGNEGDVRIDSPTFAVVGSTNCVGIGTYNPSAKLHVNGNLHLQGTNQDISWETGQALQIGEWDGATFTERMMIKSGGNVELIGDYGAGLSGVILKAENTNASGISFYGKTHGDDATVVFAQNGTGDIIRGFNSGGLPFRVDNSGHVITPVITITGGSDLAEPFAMSDDSNIPEGALVVIDDQNPGKLRMSNQPYDHRVAGVVSGAGGINPGITLSQPGALEDGRDVALSGRVYALADASNGAIQPGDLLTTSSTPGHAMKATDRNQSHGAIIGKAMGSLEAGQGLVLVLVNLQ